METCVRKTGMAIEVKRERGTAGHAWMMKQAMHVRIKLEPS
jgi:hypothetical protein